MFGFVYWLKIWYNGQEKVGNLRKISTILAAVFMPVAALAAREGTPTYYKSYDQMPSAVAAQQRNVIGQQVAASQVFAIPTEGAMIGALGVNGAVMTPSGVAFESPNDWTISANYTRRFANFQFETGVQSVLKWDDMIFNEFSAQVRRDFKMRDYDLFLFGEYSHGIYESGGMSTDFDLKPYDDRFPNYGLFTISVGDQGGSTNRMKFGLGAWRVFDVLGWKISPSVGYEIFHHDLEMSDHYYPNQATYIPLLDELGNYIIGDEYGKYGSISQGQDIPEGWYQVCIGPEDILMAQAGTNGPLFDPITGQLLLRTYDDSMGDLPWGVPAGNCVIIGGDGPIVVEGVTHIYNTTWTGIYVGLELEKQMTYTDKLRFYGQLSLPKYSSEGIWPNRDDWQQHPSFIDEGDNGAFAYRLEMEYNFSLNENLILALKADTEYFHVGKVPGTLFVAEYSAYVVDEYGQYVVDAQTGFPIIETIEAHEEHIQDSLKSATWTSFGLSLGLKYTF